MTAPTLEPGDLLTLHQVAERLNVNYRTAFRMVKAGHLRAYKVSGLWRVHKDDLSAYLFGGSMKESMERHPSRAS